MGTLMEESQNPIARSNRNAHTKPTQSARRSAIEPQPSLNQSSSQSLHCHCPIRFHTEDKFPRSPIDVFAAFLNRFLDEGRNVSMNASSHLESAGEELDTPLDSEVLVLGNFRSSSSISNCERLRGSFSEVRRGKRIEHGEIRRENTTAN